MEALASSPLAYILGRYALGKEIARGGMAAVHLGLVLGEAGFSRIVAVKRLLPGLAGDPDLAASFLEEARLAARIRHPNVVPTLDVLAPDGEVFLVMEYVHGESLAGLVRAAAGQGTRIPVAVVSAILVNALHGLHAAHEAKDERGAPLDLVHRDVSPQNVLVGVDGVARVLDFGIARAAGRAQTTREGQVKGKLGYMAPEQLRQHAERASDLYACGVCLWEALTQRRLFAGDNESAVLAKVLAGIAPPPSRHVPDLPPELDAVALRALHRDPAQRFATAREMARALESAAPPAPPAEVGEWVEQLAGPRLARRAEQIAEMEASRAFGAVSLPPAPPVEPAPERRADAVTAPAMALPVSAPPALLDFQSVTVPMVPFVMPPAAGWSAPLATPPAAPASALEAAPRPSRRRWTWLAGGGLSVLFATGALFAAVPKGSRAVAESPVDVVSARPPLVPAAATDTAPPSTPPLASGSASAPDVAPTASSPAPSPAATGARPRSAPAGAPKVSCDPPYSVGPDQVRHYKKQCFK